MVQRQPPFHATILRIDESGYWVCRLGLVDCENFHLLEMNVNRERSTANCVTAVVYQQ